MSRRRGNAKRTCGVGESSPVTGLLPLATPMCEASAPTPPASTSSVAAFHVKTCRTLGRALASRVSAAVCGSSSRESFAIYDHASSSWRTSQRSLLAGWTPFSGAFPKRGMMRSGLTFELPTLVPRIVESDSSSSRGSEMWGTARAHIGAGDPVKRAARGMLEGQVITATWPTPSASMHNDAEDPTQWLAACAGGSLNPAWVERLMGFQDGWTSPLTDGPSAPAKRSQKASRHASRKTARSDDSG